MREIRGKEAKNEIARLDGLEMAWKCLWKVRGDLSGGRGRQKKRQKRKLENPGIDPGTSRTLIAGASRQKLLSGRSTI